MIADRGRTGEQSIQRNQRGDGGENREKAVEDHARRDCKQAVLADLLIGAPEDVFPALPRYLPWRLGVTAPAGLLRSFVLRGNRFVGAAADPKSACCRAAPSGRPAVNAADLACDHHADQHRRAQQGPKWGLGRRTLRFCPRGPGSHGQSIRAAGAFCRAASRSQAQRSPPYRAGFRWSCEATCQR